MEPLLPFGSTFILICQTSPITICDKSHYLERKYVVFAIPVSQKQRCQLLFFLILDSLSAQMNVPITKFSGNIMLHLKLCIYVSISKQNIKIAIFLVLI